MDAAAFDQQEVDLQDFHAYFAPLSGCRGIGTKAAIIPGPCWCNRDSGAMPVICRRRLRHQPGWCRKFSQIPLGP